MSSFSAVTFEDPRLGMTHGGRMVVRVVSSITYLLFIALTLLLLISDLPTLQFLGVFLLLVWADRLVHAKESDRHLGELTEGQVVNAALYTEPRAYAAVERAWTASRLTQKSFPLVLLIELLRFHEIREVFLRLDIEPQAVADKIEAFEAVAGFNEPDGFLNHTSMMSVALDQAVRHRRRAIEPADLLVGLFSIAEKSLEKLGEAFSFTPETLQKSADLTLFIRDMRLVRGRSHHKAPPPPVNRAWTSRPTPFLDSLGSDLTEMARHARFGGLIGHAKKYEEMVTILSHSMKPHVLLIGEGGSGKTTMIEHLATQIIHDEIPDQLTDKRVLSLDISRAIAGAAGNEVHERMQRIVAEIVNADTVILAIPDIHHLFKTSGQGFTSAAELLAKTLEEHHIPVVATTTPKEFKEVLEPRSDFMNTFEVFQIGEITQAEAEEVLVRRAALLEKTEGVTIGFKAIRTAVEVGARYLHHKSLPGNALELLDEAVSEARAKRMKVLTSELIVALAETKTNVPVHLPGKEETESLLHLEDEISKDFIGQKEAVTAIADALREYRSGLTRKGGPIASFLFVGPTGVGKTALAKLVAKIQFGSEAAMLRFDMSEYQDKKSFYQFIGAPDGTIPGNLTEAVRDKPYSLILLDEFEKAHPDILNLFLQVLDDGRLTDGLGRTVDFQNTVIVATSNAHSAEIHQAIQAGKPISIISENLRHELIDVYKPELLNRFSKIIVFQSISPEDLLKITGLELKTFQKTLLEQRILLDFDPAVVKKIAEIGYDPTFGARPLRQAIEEHLRAPLAKELLAKKIHPGSRVKVEMNGNEFSFTTS